jgi:hypothetical protein
MIGIYSNNLERFILIKKDLWVTLSTARLLSSKLCLTVFLIELDSNITNNNCLTWGLVNPELAVSDRQLARLSIIQSHDIVDLKSFSPDIDRNKMLDYHQFSEFVYASLESAWITDALLNPGDQKFFINLIDPEFTLTQVSDNTGMDESFLYQINKILYLSNNKQEALASFENLFIQDTIMPTNLRLYRNIFNNYLKKNEIIL